MKRISGENGQKVGKETVAGWFDEMCYKTIFRAAYNDITIDSEKIDEHFLKMIETKTEEEGVEEKVKTQINNEANKADLNFDDAVIVDDKQLQQGNESSNNQVPPVQQQTGPNF